MARDRDFYQMFPRGREQEEQQQPQPAPPTMPNPYGQTPMATPYTTGPASTTLQEAAGQTPRATTAPGGPGPQPPAEPARPLPDPNSLEGQLLYSAMGGMVGGVGKEMPTAANPTGDPRIDALRGQLAQNWQLGTFDLSDPATQSRAFSQWDEYLRAIGAPGVEALRSEIGDVRTLDRLREFFGKGDTLTQSGRINVGDGMVISSLRDLADFNQPGTPDFGGFSFQPIQTQWGPLGMDGTYTSGQYAGLRPGQLIPGTGPGNPGSPARFAPGGQRDTTLGGQRPAAPAPAPAAAATGGLAWAPAALQEVYETGGVDPELLAQTQESLREQQERQFQSTLPALQEALARRGIGGAGIEARETANLLQNLAGQAGTNLRDVSTQMGLQGMANMLGAAETAAGLGTTQRGQDITQQLGLGQLATTRRGQDIDRQLGLQDIALRRQLGLGGLDIQGQQVANALRLGLLGENRLMQGQLVDQQLSWADFGLALERARQGDYMDALGMLYGAASRSAEGRRE